MHTIAMLPIPEPRGYEDLTSEELAMYQGGALPVWAIPVGAYVGKMVIDNWADFKRGIREGYRAVAGNL